MLVLVKGYTPDLGNIEDLLLKAEKKRTLEPSVTPVKMAKAIAALEKDGINRGHIVHHFELDSRPGNRNSFFVTAHSTDGLTRQYYFDHVNGKPGTLTFIRAVPWTEKRDDWNLKPIDFQGLAGQLEGPETTGAKPTRFNPKGRPPKERAGEFGSDLHHLIKRLNVGEHSLKSVVIYRGKPLRELSNKPNISEEGSHVLEVRSTDRSAVRPKTFEKLDRRDTWVAVPDKSI